MKRLISTLLVVVLALTLFTACGAGESKTAESAQQSAADVQTTSKEPRTFVVATGGSSQSSPISAGADVFAAKLEEYSGGLLRADVYYDTQLGSTQDLVDGVQQGSIDFTEAGNTYYAAYVPELQAIELPFMFESYEQAREVLSGEALEYIQKQFEGTGIKVLAFWELGFRHLTNDEHPIHCMDDVKGLKIRTLSSAIQVAAWEAFGAVPTPIDFSELYSSLQQRVVVGQENPLSEIVSKKFYEIQKYITLTGHVYSPGPWSVSEATWNSLTEQEQEWVMLATEDATAAMFAANDELNANAISEMQTYGCEVDLNPELEDFQITAQSVYSIFTDEYGSAFLDILMESK